jgi:hypothetical protein
MPVTRTKDAADFKLLDGFYLINLCNQKTQKFEWLLMLTAHIFVVDSTFEVIWIDLKISAFTAVTVTTISCV